MRHGPPISPSRAVPGIFREADIACSFNDTGTYRYDIHGNVKELIQDIPQLGTDGGSCTGCVDHRYKKLRYTYDLISGNVKQVVYQPGRDDQMRHRYTYDADNRITEVETSADALVWHRDAEYFYYPHGPLQRVELGEHKVQGMDYAYTLQGWLKGINSDALVPKTDMGHDGLAGTANALVGRDAFGESIGYYGDGDYKAIDGARWGGSLERPFAALGTTGTLALSHNPLYNGNIAHTVHSLQPWGGWTSPVQPAQVLAQVYRYDQLNRLKQAQGVQGLTSANTWDGVTDAVADRYKSEYTYDANGNIETVARHDRGGHLYDAMNYGYHTDAHGRKLRNRPYNIQDLADQDGDYAQDIPQMAYQPNGIVDPQDVNNTINSANNFSYDVLGQRTKDKKADIELIEWTATGKMKRVHHTTASGKPDILFAYDGAGNRILKQVGDPDVDPTGYREHYVLDAQGNIMAVYRYTNTGPKSLKVVERPVYGSKRLGSYTRAMELVGEQTIINYPYTQPMQAPLKRYELTDHLGNVATVVSGRLLPGNNAGSPYQAEVLSATLHEPFGLELTGMNWQSNTARFGFQNQIKDLELNAIHFKYREYFPSDGVFPSIDPLWAKYPFYSPYAFSGNRVIDMVELEGLEPAPIQRLEGLWNYFTNQVSETFKPVMKLIDDHMVLEVSATVSVGPAVEVKVREGSLVEVGAKVNMYSVDLATGKADLTDPRNPKSYTGGHIGDGGQTKVTQGVGVTAKEKLFDKVGVELDASHQWNTSSNTLSGTSDHQNTSGITVGWELWDASQSSPMPLSPAGAKTEGAAKASTKSDECSFCLDIGAKAQVVLGVELNLKVGVK